MSEIQVTTSDLHNGSQNLHGAANELGEVQSQLSDIPGSVGDAYEGQLRQALEEIMGGAIHMGGRLQNRSVDLGNELFTRATGFEAANEAGHVNMLASSYQYHNFIESSPTLKALSFLSRPDMIKANFLWSISGLSIGALITWTASLFTNAKRLTSALYLTKNFGWSPLRPNSIIFSGPNWMRKALGIKEATRVIKPTTLAKGMAVAGLAESAWDTIGAIREDLTDPQYQSTSQKISVAISDGGFRFAISAIGTVGIPLILGAVVSTVGLPVVAGGAVVLAGTVVLGIGYGKLIETPVWDSWKQSDFRQETIDIRANQIDNIIDFSRELHNRAIKQVTEAFEEPIRLIVTSP